MPDGPLGEGRPRKYSVGSRRGATLASSGRAGRLVAGLHEQSDDAERPARLGTVNLQLRARATPDLTGLTGAVRDTIGDSTGHVGPFIGLGLS
jgi:hypothetical protein